MMLRVGGTPYVRRFARSMRRGVVANAAYRGVRPTGQTVMSPQHDLDDLPSDTVVVRLKVKRGRLVRSVRFSAAL